MVATAPARYRDLLSPSRRSRNIPLERRLAHARVLDAIDGAETFVILFAKSGRTRAKVEARTANNGWRQSRCADALPVVPASNPW